MPPHHSTAAILSIGDELTLGQTLDTNSKWLSARLTDLGITPVEHVTVPDDARAHADALIRLAPRVDVIISTGGLGPTADDLTRQALALATSDTLTEDPLALAQVESWFVARGQPMPQLNRAQALRPTRAQSLPNLHGTAPGLHSGRGLSDRPGPDIFCLPGPPSEMKPMFEAQVLPRLRPSPGRTILTRTLHCIGIGESVLATRLGDLMDRDRNPLVGTTASGGVISVRIRYEGNAVGEQAEQAIAATESLARERAYPYVFGFETDTLPGVILTHLKQRRETLATVESCTGGLLGGMITDIPGSSAVYLGGWVTYTNELKQSQTGVPRSLFESGAPGAVSRECATAMAVGARSRSGAAYALSITGIAGPSGGSADKPVGTVWIALAHAAGVDARQFRMAGDRRAVRDWSAKAALAMLYFHLCDEANVRLLRQVV